MARWKCTLSQHHYTEDERPRRRATSLPSGENYHDLGLDQPSDRQLQLIRRLGSEALLKGIVTIILNATFAIEVQRA